METQANLIKELRERTGAPILQCKEALKACGQDIEKAITYLRERGIARAAKKIGRETKEGVVASYIHPGGKIGVLVEVNCETDFVARNEEFNQFVKDITMHIAAANPLYLKREEVPEELIKKEEEIYTAQAKSLNKPEKVIQQIVKGQMDKFFSEVCLMEQPFIKDEKITIKELLTSMIAKFGENIVIRRFSRFQLGEPLKTT